MVLQGEFAKPFGIVKFSREATNFAAGKIASTFERASGAQRASPRSSLVSSSRAVAHSCRRDQPARIQRIPVRRCRRPACAVADASETMPPKIPFPGSLSNNPSACYAGTSPYTGEALGNDLSRQRFAPPTGACRPVLAGNSPLDCFSGARTPIGGGQGGRRNAAPAFADAIPAGTR